MLQFSFSYLKKCGESLNPHLSLPSSLFLTRCQTKSLGLQTCRVSQSGACVFKHVSTHTHEIYLLSPYWYFKFKFRTRGCLLNHFHTIPVDPILHTQNPHSWQHRGDLEYPIITRLLYPFSCVRLRTLTLAPPGKRLKTAENPLRIFQWLSYPGCHNMQAPHVPLCPSAFDWPWSCASQTISVGPQPWDCLFWSSENHPLVAFLGRAVGQVVPKAAFPTDSSLFCPLYLTASLLAIKSCIFISFLEDVNYVSPFSSVTKQHSKKV